MLQPHRASLTSPLLLFPLSLLQPSRIVLHLHPLQHQHRHRHPHPHRHRSPQLSRTLHLLLHYGLCIHLGQLWRSCCHVLFFCRQQLIGWTMKHVQFKWTDLEKCSTGFQRLLRDQIVWALFILTFRYRRFILKITQYRVGIVLNQHSCAAIDLCSI